MDWNAALKYLAAGGIMAMLFGLVVMGKMSADGFEELAIGALGAIGGHTAAQLGRGGPS